MVETTNWFKWRVNEDKQAHCDDPSHDNSISSDKEEEEVPDRLTFDMMAQGLQANPNPAPDATSGNTHIPTNIPDPIAVPLGGPNAGIPALGAEDWSRIQNAAHRGTADTPVILPAPFILGDDFETLGHIFKMDSVQAEYSLNLCSLPKPILQWPTSVYLCRFCCSPLPPLTESNSMSTSNSTRYFLALGQESIPWTSQPFQTNCRSPRLNSGRPTATGWRWLM